MSSLAASRADGYYHPPEWDPQQVGRDRYQGSKGANQWEQYGVIRFEMPYNIWCGGCGKHIRKGTRFNAKKNDVRAASPPRPRPLRRCGRADARRRRPQAGKYFSTKIYAFHMKCAVCPQQIGAPPANNPLRARRQHRLTAGRPAVIKTDPKNSDYVVASGGRRKVETYDEGEAGVERLSTDSERVPPPLRLPPVPRCWAG